MNARPTLLGTLALVALFVAACDNAGQQSASELISRALMRLEHKDFRAALIDAKTAAQQEPTNAAARKLLGDIALTIDDAPSAEKELLRARELGIAADVVVPPLARALLAQGKAAEVIGLDTSGMQAPAAVAEYTAARGLAHAMTGAGEEARRDLDAALAGAPASAAVHVLDARFHLAASDLDKAAAAAATAVELDPRNAEAWRLRGDIARAALRPADAEGYFGKALELVPVHVPTRVGRATVRAALGRFDDAQADLDTLGELVRRDFGASYAQGLVHFNRKEFVNAREYLSLAYQLNDQSTATRFFLGSAELALGNQDAADGLLGGLYEQFPGQPPIRRALGLLRLQQGRFQDANALLEPLLAQNPDDKAVMEMLATGYRGAGQAEKALPLLERIAKSAPDSVEAQMRLGAALAGAGQGAAALQHFEHAAALAPNQLEARTEKILLLLQQKDTAGALAAAETFARERPGEAVAWDLLAVARDRAGQPAESELALREALRLDPANRTANLHFARLAMAKGALDEARTYYQAVLAKHGRDVRTLVALANLELRAQQASAAEAALNRAIDADPRAVEPRLLLSRLRTLQGKPSEALRLLEGLEVREFHANDYLVALGSAQLAAGRGREATDTFSQLAGRQPTSAQAQYLLGLGHRAAGSGAQAEASWRRALELEPGHRLARLTLGDALYRNGRADEAEQVLAPVLEGGARPGAAETARAMLDAARGDNASAIAHLEAAHAASPDAATLLTLTGRLWTTGQKDRAVGLTEDWLAARPDDSAVMLVHAGRLEQDGRIEQAIAWLEKLVKRDPTNVVAHNNLAWRLKEQDPARAVALATRAAELAPGAAGVQDTLAVVQLAAGDLNAALRASEKAAELDPGSGLFRYHQALVLARLGRRADATAALEQALAGAPFGDREAAARLLEQLRAE